MLAKRGTPGSPGHAALRGAQARVLDLPTHHALARVVVRVQARIDRQRVFYESLIAGQA